MRQCLTQQLAFLERIAQVNGIRTPNDVTGWMYDHDDGILPRISPAENQRPCTLTPDRDKNPLLSLSAICGIMIAMLCSYDFCQSFFNIARASSLTWTISLGISVDTVEKHLKSIYKKLGVTSRTEAVVWWLEKGTDFRT